MNKRGMKDMIALNYTINKVIEKPHKKISTSEAKEILKKCGVMTKRDNIKSAYKTILVRAEDASDGKK